MIWGAEIAWYLFLAGLGAGAYATAAWLAWKRPEAKIAQRWGRIIAPVVVAIGLVLLMVDASAGIKNPLRFFLLVTNLSSVMAWGVIILSAFMVVAVAGLVLNVAGKRNPRWLDAVGSVLALAVAAYTGVLLGASPAFPLWNPVLLPVLFVVSAASTGIAAVLLAAQVRAAGEMGELAALKRFHGTLPLVELALVVVLLLVTNGVAGSSASAAAAAGAASVANLVSGGYAVLFWAGFMIVGLLVPIGVDAFGSRVRRRVKATAGTDGSAAVAVVVEAAAPSVGLEVAAEVGILVGGFLLRFLIVAAAVPIG